MTKPVIVSDGTALAKSLDNRLTLRDVHRPVTESLCVKSPGKRSGNLPLVYSVHANDDVKLASFVNYE